MSGIVMVGSQWGDEGKGKLVDWLGERADVVVRFNGGHNAGHTLVVDGEEYKLALLPSGLVRGKLSLIGNGVVVDPKHFNTEVTTLRSRGLEVTPDNLIVSEGSSLILSVHRELDAARESSGGRSIGTTQRGVGPAYEDKIGRRAVRACDLREPLSLTGKVANLLSHHNPLRIGLGLQPVEIDTIVSEILTEGATLIPFIGSVSTTLEELHRQNARVLFEGAQGALLDNDHGTYPFVTSSTTTVGGALTGSGIGPAHIRYVLGITKAYSTRVGNGSMPTEQLNEAGELLGTRGAEFGVNTGRKRRCGWFDAVAVRQTVQLSGINGLALTKIDVLDEFKEIQVCVGYSLDGRRIDRIPMTQEEQARVQPIYETLPGWDRPTAGLRTWDDLPKNAVAYIRFIEKQTHAPVVILSTGPDRLETILLRDPFLD
ncbi:adenylosuccinate synthase [Xanthobacter sp. VNH20]|uniref:adenylosuccinate synthase n=1 Tax=Xanthobacter sp. VNH20 TaxID=3156616 RepID=UPI0032B3EB4E